MKLKVISFILLVFALLLSGCTKEIIDPGRNSSALLFYGENYPSRYCDQDGAVTVGESSYENNDFSSEVVCFLPGVYDLGQVEMKVDQKFISTDKSKATIVGSSYFHMSERSSVVGFTFIGGASPSAGRYEKERFGSIAVKGDYSTIAMNTFIRGGEGSTKQDRTGITIEVIRANDILIHGNVFKNSKGIAIKFDDHSKRAKIVQNQFLESEKYGGAGEVVHFGNAYSEGQGQSPYDDSTWHLFINNRIDRWNIEKELISIKSDSNVIAYNRISNSAESAIVVRMGNDNQILNNTMTGVKSFPVRISGERNIIQSNVFCGTGYAISLHVEKKYNAKLEGLVNSYWAAKDNIVLGNTYFGFEDIAKLDKGYAIDPDYIVSYPSGNEIFNNHFYGLSNPVDMQEYGVVWGKNQVLENKGCILVE